MSIYDFLECEKGQCSIPKHLKEFEELIYSDVPVGNFSYLLPKFTFAILVELSSQLGGMQYFLSQGQSEEGMFDAWERTLADYTAAHIFFGVEYVLSARYDRNGSFCPKYPLQFRHLLKDLSSNFEFHKRKIFPKINNFEIDKECVTLDTSIKQKIASEYLSEMKKRISDCLRVTPKINAMGGEK